MGPRGPKAVGIKPILIDRRGITQGDDGKRAIKNLYELFDN